MHSNIRIEKTPNSQPIQGKGGEQTRSIESLKIKSTGRYQSEILLPSRFHFIVPTSEFVMHYAAKAHVPTGSLEKLRVALNDILSMAITSNQSNDSGEKIVVQLNCSMGKFQIKIHNLGLPIFPNIEWSSIPIDLANRNTFLRARDNVERLTFTNLGRNGQIFTLELKSEAIQLPESETQALMTTNDCATDIEIRSLYPGEETGLSRLFFSVYGYDYINESVYFPEKIKEMIVSGKLVSTVAVNSQGKIVGHVGMLRWNNEPVVYEVALGAVEPTMNSLGIFSTLFTTTINKINEIPMQYAMCDLVTNHDYSQRLVMRNASYEMALFVGSQISRTQARLAKLGIGVEPVDTDRYSLLLAVTPRVANPFGKEIVLPANIGELADFLLKPLGVNWIPAPRFYPLPAEGKYTITRQDEQNAVLFCFDEPGRQALLKILDEWHYLLQSGFQYAGIDVPLNYPGLGQVYDLLAKHGFFVAGFVPFKYSAQLAFRFQFVAPSKIAFQEIKVYTPQAKRLLRMVQSDYERNTLL